MVRVQLFDQGFEPVRPCAQAHGTGQTGATLEGVQDPQGGIARLQVAGVRGPLAQRRTEPRQELLRLFLEDWEQVGVDGVARIRLVIDLCRSGRRDASMG